MRTTLIHRQDSSQGHLSHMPRVSTAIWKKVLYTLAPTSSRSRPCLDLPDTFYHFQAFFYKSQKALHSYIQLSFLFSTSLWLLLINDLWKCTQSLIGLYTESFCHQVHTLFFYWHHDLAPVAVMGMSQNLLHANYYFQQSESHQSKKNTVPLPKCLQFRQYFDTPQQST